MNRTEQRFAFGKNWQYFLKMLNVDRIVAAEQSLKEMLDCDDLVSKSFLDIGSGSGLFSLAGARLGAAQVLSFDYDQDSVASTRSLKEKFSIDDCNWRVTQGSVLDTPFLSRLGTFDVVYSWGVLHHTGDMWNAFENVVPLVKAEGQLFIAIYNDQGIISMIWKRVKKIYNMLPQTIQKIYFYIVLGIMEFFRLVQFFYRGENPFKTGKRTKRVRGMSYWHDALDWIGGYPFEVASPKVIRRFFQARGFVLEREKLVRGAGCNEYVFRRAN